MPHRVLDQGLENEGRDPARAAPGLQHDVAVETRPVADPLDVEIGADHRQLILQPYLVLAPEPHAAAEEVGQPQAHAPRAGRIGRGQGADRLEAVEEEVRVDLRAQGLELRLARQDLEAELARLGAARLIEDGEQVVQQAGEPEQQHPGGGDGRELRGREARRVAERRQTGQHAGPPGPRRGPHRRRHHPRAGVHDERPSQRRGRQRRGAADVPGGQADERQDQAGRHDHDEGDGDAGAGAGVRGRPGDGAERPDHAPGRQVEVAPPGRPEDGMHGSVLRPRPPHEHRLLELREGWLRPGLSSQPPPPP